jgi:hypothetical protein
MLIYRSDHDVVPAGELLQRLSNRIAALKAPAHDEVISVFIDLGEFESAIADSLFPNEDGIHPLTDALQSAARQSAHALISSWREESQARDRAIQQLEQRLRALPRADLPQDVALRPSEGYAYYALRPETYVVAAERWIRDRRPASVVCIGIRSIGCSLSAAVAAATERAHVAVARYTVRPRGHPFDRRVALDDRLAARLRKRGGDAHFLVVDEGPGLSGSSFASVVIALHQLGVPAQRIVLFPSSNPDGSAFCSETARGTWNDHQRAWANDRDARLSVEDITGEYNGVDISGGKWRRMFWPGHTAPAAVQPQHEVVKRWLPGSSTVVRFAGLGRYGEGKLQRSEILAGAGLGPRPLKLERGYLWLPFVASRSWSEPCEALVDAIAHHCAFLTRAFPARRSPSIDSLFEMILTNLREGCDGEASLSDLDQYRAVLDAAPCAAIDGRMLPHEWLHVGATFVKVDALDHHQDHFFPGTQDAGWDLAAASFELDLDSAARARLIQSYIAESRDGEVVWRMPFYDIAYPAFRLGYAVMAAQALGDTEDAKRFQTIAGRCRARLAHVLNCNVPAHRRAGLW